MENIITEVIDNYIESKCMLKEYKNPIDSETIRTCADTLENMYNNIIYNGASRHEYVIQQLWEAIRKLRKLEDYFK